MDTAAIQPMTLYGSNVCCFTGICKITFEHKAVPYVFRALQSPADEHIIKNM